MKHKSIILAVAWTEMLIGVSTVMGLSASVVMSAQHKPFNVFVFVLASAWASFGIGLGVLFHKEWARMLLVFFSGYIILTKVLVFTGLMHFNGELITAVPTDIKNLISIAYHLFVIVHFTRMSVKKEFTP